MGELSFADALTDISQTLVGTVDAAAVHRTCQQRLFEKAQAYAHIDDDTMALVTEHRERGLTHLG